MKNLVFAVLLLLTVVLYPQTLPGLRGKIAYVHGGDVWVKTLPDGAERQISQSGGDSPQWSASGLWLAFHQKQKTIALPANGDTARAFTSEGGQGYSWAPREDALAFTDRDGLWVIRFNGDQQEKRIVLRNPASSLIPGFSWSPDGNSFAVTIISSGDGQPEDRVARLLLVGADGSDPHPLFSVNDLSASEKKIAGLEVGAPNADFPQR